MRPGDIMTHCYAQHHPVLLEDGTVNPAIRRAGERGVLFDMGHGGASFWFRLAKPSIDQGFLAHTISTDLHKWNVTDLVVNMTTTMSKILNLGVPLDEVIRMSTVAPASAIHRPELGTLSVGSVADIAVLEERHGAFGFFDSGDGKLIGDRKLFAKLTVHKGEVVYDAEGWTRPRWEDAPPRYWQSPVLHAQE